MKKYTHDIAKLKQNRIMNFQIGVIIALLVAIAVINSSFDVYEHDEVFTDVLSDPEIEMPITYDDRKKSPPPEKIEEKEIIEDIEDLKFDPEPEPEPVKPDVKLNPKETVAITDKPVKAPVIKKTKKAEAPIVKPEPIKIEGDDDPFKIVDQMPLFKKGAKIEDEKELREYSSNQIIKFIQKHVKYPALARENGIEGTVYISFIVEKDGSISNVKVAKGKGYGLNKEALRVVQKLPNWERAGRKKGKKVRVYYTLPIKFKLKGI